jgi:hypothetical protein
MYVCTYLVSAIFINYQNSQFNLHFANLSCPTSWICGYEQIYLFSISLMFTNDKLCPDSAKNHVYVLVCSMNTSTIHGLLPFLYGPCRCNLRNTV